MFRLKKTACLLLLPVLLGGCDLELPYVGNVQEKILPLLDTLENTLTPLKGVIHPLREQFFPQEEQQVQRGPHRRRSRTAAAGRNTPGEADGEEAQPEATPTPAPNPKHKGLENNMAFDHWRSEGIRKIYEGETLEAIHCFKKALALRPNDPNIQDWLFLVENRSSRNGKKAVAPPPDSMPEAPAPAAPAAPALPAGPNLF